MNVLQFARKPTLWASLGRGVPAALFGLLLSGGAVAGTQVGKVADIQIRASDGLVLFYLTGDPAGRASCAASTKYWMIKNENSDTGKRQIALLLSARSIGATVSVYGANTCSRWGDGEDADAITLMAQ